MILVITAILLNIVTFYFDSDMINLNYLVSVVIMCYKGNKCNSIKEIYNIGNFNFKLNKNHFLELITSFLISLSIDKLYTYNFEVTDLIGFVVYSLLMYRFFLFNTLSLKKINYIHKGDDKMFFIYDWLKESESVSQIFFRLMIVLLSLIMFILSILGISYIINRIIISSSENYILISMTKFNSIIIVILMLSIVLASYLYRSAMKDIKEFRFGWKSERNCRICFIISLITIILGLVYSSNNYYVFGNDKIEKHSILGTAMYTYKDVKSVDTGYKKIKYDEHFYYKVNLKNGESIDIVNGLVLEPNEKDVVLKVAQIINKNK